MAFSVKLKGLEDIRKRFSGDRIAQNVAVQLGKAATLVDKELRSGVSARYRHPKSLDSVREGKSKTLQIVGKNLIKTDLSYKYKPVPLSDFPTQERTVPVTAAYLWKQRDNRDRERIRRIQKNYAIELTVNVLRKSGFKVPHKYGQPAFLVKPTRSAEGVYTGLPAKKYRRGVYVRKQYATWEKQLFERAPIEVLFGPSLSQAAEYVYETTNLVAIIQDAFQSFIRDL